MPLLERELAVGIRGVVVHVAVAAAQQAALLQKALASHHALEHAPDLTRRQVRQRVKDDVLSVVLVNAVEKEHVQMRKPTTMRAIRNVTRPMIDAILREWSRVSAGAPSCARRVRVTLQPLLVHPSPSSRYLRGC